MEGSRAKLAAGLAGAGAALAVAVVLLHFQVSPVATWFYVTRRPLLNNTDTILLADFDNKTGEAIFDETLKQALAMQFEQSRLLNLLPEPRVRKTLRLMERSPEERVTGQLAREICVRNNLKALIAGSIVALGGHYVITLETINGQSGETLARQVAEADGVSVQADPQPLRNVFVRSDQYSFIRHGIPSVKLDVGFDPDSPEQKIFKDWLTKRYHAPSDDLAQPVELASAALYEEVIRQLLISVANTDARPKWKPESFFRRYATAY